MKTKHDLSPDLQSIIMANLKAANDAKIQAEATVAGICTAEAVRAFGPGKRWRLTEDMRSIEAVEDQK